MIPLIHILLFSICEGFRESCFYKINKAGGFPDIKSDKKRKKVNVLAFCSVMVIFIGVFPEPYTCWSLVTFIVFSLIIRWLIIDGTLNLTRGFPLFYVGTVALTDLIQRKISKWLNVNPSVLSGIIKTSLLISITILFYHVS